MVKRKNKNKRNKGGATFSDTGIASGESHISVVAKDDTSFANHALKILKDDLIWLSNHKAAIKNQRNWSWDNAASEFEKLI